MVSLGVDGTTSKLWFSSEEYCSMGIETGASVARFGFFDPLGTDAEQWVQKKARMVLELAGGDPLISGTNSSGKELFRKP